MIDADQVTHRLWDDEGFVASAYYDSKGFLTIGCGILIDSRRGGGITAEEGMYLLRNRIYRVHNQCIDRFPWLTTKLNKTRQQIIVCMAYQLGVNGVANFKRMVAGIERKDFKAAAAEMLDSDWARKDSPERAKRMATMMESGQWVCT